MPSVNLSFNVPINKDEFDIICKNTVATIPNLKISEMPYGFLVQEDKFDFYKGTYLVKANVSFLNNIVTISAKCSGIGPIQKNHVNEVANIIKGVIERGVSEKDNDSISSNDLVRCPKCGSTQVQIQKRGFTLATGLFGSGKNERVCMHCMYKF